MDRWKAILIGLIVVLGILITINFLTINSGFSENYTYNMSESEINDEWVTQTCMKLQINSPECDLVYGGVMDKVSDGRVK